jgi:hypothetical protein
MSGLPPLTVLNIPELGIPPYSGRGITQTLEPIQAAQVLQRSVNARLINLTPVAFQLYKSTITCDDQDPPNLDGVWPGFPCTVYCIVEIGQAAASFQRPAVPGSTRTDDAGNTFYRPILYMTFMKFTIDRDEWGAACRWQLELEETAPPGS